jgi:DNA-binding transcriptional MerR regulator
MARRTIEPARRLKMKALEGATGVGRETIRFYIRAGLLPEPKRPGRNVAWYDEAFVERIRLIKELQQKRFLPLQVIKAIVGGDARPPRNEVQTLLELDGKIFPLVAGKPTPPPEKLSVVAKRTKLTAAEIRRLANVEAIEIEIRDGDQWLDDTAIRIVELWAHLRAAGFTDARGVAAENLRMYVDFVRWLAREELRIFAHTVTGAVPTPEAARMAEAGITLLNQILGLVRRATLLRYIAAGNLPEAASGTRPPVAVNRG